MTRKVDLLAWAAGAVTGVLLERRFIRRQVRPSTSAPEFPTLEGLRETSVMCPDRVLLAVRETGPRTAPLTVVFVHGYTVTAECWAAQVRDLEAADPQLRMVLYDQRGHGASTVGPAENDTIEQLGRDLAEVLRQRTSDGRVVLVGHSMGGMTIMALAEARPELFGAKVAAVALVSTSSGGMGEVSLGLPAALAGLPGRVMPYLPRTAPLDRRAERLRASDSDLTRLINAKVAFAPGASEPDLAAMSTMQAPMRLETMAAFVPTFGTHQRTEALAPLKTIPTLILVGEEDKLTPLSHSQLIAEELPAAELIVVPGAGHMVIMEEPHVVSAALRNLLGRVR